MRNYISKSTLNKRMYSSHRHNNNHARIQFLFRSLRKLEHLLYHHVLCAHAHMRMRTLYQIRACAQLYYLNNQAAMREHGTENINIFSRTLQPQFEKTLTALGTGMFCQTYSVMFSSSIDSSVLRYYVS